MSFPALRVRSFEFPDGTFVDRHSHLSCQLIYSVSGSMAIQTDLARWYVPPSRGVWMPARMDHAIQCIGDVSMKTAFVRQDRAVDMPSEPHEVAVSRALRELLLDLADRDDVENLPLDAFADVVKSYCRPVEHSALQVPTEVERTIAPVVGALLRDPSDATSLEEWAKRLHCSGRTITRSFRRSTGMSFRQWRQQVALLHAVSRLADGAGTTAVAEELGYENVGSFIDVFKKRFGVTPGRYL